MNFWQARMLAKKRAAQAWHLYDAFERNALVATVQAPNYQEALRIARCRASNPNAVTVKEVV